MKGVKGKLVRKLKTVQGIGTPKSQGLASQPPKTTPKESYNGGTNHDHHEEKLVKTTPSLGSKPSKEISYNASADREDNVTQKGSEISSKHLKENNGGDESSLSEFEEKCPPGGRDKVVLYTTSLRGVRKTFEDCSAVRFLLESYKVSFCERDVSLHREFRDELWELLEVRVMPPRLFIKGRYIGGADEVVGVLNEQGTLRRLFSGIPVIHSRCHACANVRFSVCFNCNGSKKISKDDAKNRDGPCHVRCPECNENGLVKCEFCS